MNNLLVISQFIFDVVHLECSLNWENNVNVDKSIYVDFFEYREVKIREYVHQLAVNKGLMK